MEGGRECNRVRSMICSCVVVMNCWVRLCLEGVCMSRRLMGIIGIGVSRERVVGSC